MKLSAKKKIIYLILGVLAVLFFNFPIFWIVLNSVKPTDLIFSSPTSIVFLPTISHFSNVFTQTPFLRYISNSLIIALISSLLTLILSFPVGYSIARFKTGGKHLLFWLLSLRISPPVVFIIPIYFMFQEFHLLDQHLGLILIYQTFSVPLAVWMFKSFIQEIPIDYEEAALIDGATRWQVMRWITLRLSLPVIIAVSVLAFIASWNEYLFALTLTITKSRTWSVGSQIFVGTYDIQWGELAASAILGVIPPLILAFLLRKWLVEGLTMGLVKG